MGLRQRRRDVSWPGSPRGDYHLVFWITGGISLVAGIVGGFLVRDSAPPVKGRHHDLLGAALLTAWLVRAAAGRQRGRLMGLGPRGACSGSSAAAVVLAVVWVLVERRVAEPLVEMAMPGAAGQGKRSARRCPRSCSVLVLAPC
ncbi:hypothetical protein GCM10020220_034920 [Nonomuraea rubra]|uniref:hypothetical protein n=1 Tax=Nonomuraea rubra TaxID=46180 RepID=UPI0031E6DC1B